MHAAKKKHLKKSLFLIFDVEPLGIWLTNLSRNVGTLL